MSYLFRSGKFLGLTWREPWQTPLQDIAKVLDISIPSIGDPHYDDTSLALLFSQLKMKTLQTAKGTSEISGRREFNFVLQIARVFCRMGTLSPSLTSLFVLVLTRKRSNSLRRLSYPRVGPREIVVIRSTRWRNLNGHVEHVPTHKFDVSHRSRGSFRDAPEYEKGKQDLD